MLLVDVKVSLLTICVTNSIFRNKGFPMSNERVQRVEITFRCFSMKISKMHLSAKSLKC